MTADEVRALWAKYLSGAALSPEEESALLQGLEGDETLRREFIEDVKVQGLLRARKRAERDSASFERSFLRCLEAKGDEDRFIRKVESRMAGVGGAEGKPARRVRRAREGPPRSWKGPAAAAAAVLLALAAGVLFFGGEKPPIVARVDRVQGTALLLPDRVRVEPGQELRSGQGVETLGAASRAAIACLDGTRLDVGADAILGRVEDGEAGKRVRFDKGALTAVVVKQSAGRSMVFATPQGEARVLGTTLRLLVDPDPRKGTTLEVTEGKVRLQNLAGQTLDVPGGHTAVAAAGLDLVAKPISQKPSRGADLIRQMPPNTWLSVPQTPLRRVVPHPEQVPKIQQLGPGYVITCWSGGAFDSRRNRLLVWGGGPTQYHGNELYAFAVDTLSWERLTDPTPDPVDGGLVNEDGTPNARSTYNGLAYLAHADRFFACGGDLAGSARRGIVSPLTWVFDFTRKRWENRDPAGEKPPTHHGCTCAYDPVSRKLWWPDTGSGSPGLYSYDFDANLWAKHTSDFFNGHQTSAIDTRRGKLVIVGQGDAYSYDLRGGKFERELLKTTGGDPLVASSFPGLDYDPVADRIVGWAGGAVYALDLDAKVWTAYDRPGAPTPTPVGIFGRWRYVPSVGAFVVVTSVDDDVHFFKLPAPRDK